MKLTKNAIKDQRVGKSYIGVIGSEGTPTSKQITLKKKATHKKPVCSWKPYS